MDKSYVIQLAASLLSKGYTIEAKTQVGKKVYPIVTDMPTTWTKAYALTLQLPQANKGYTIMTGCIPEWFSKHTEYPLTTSMSTMLQAELMGWEMVGARIVPTFIGHMIEPEFAAYNNTVIATDVPLESPARDDVVVARMIDVVHAASRDVVHGVMGSDETQGQVVLHAGIGLEVDWFEPHRHDTIAVQEVDSLDVQKHNDTIVGHESELGNANRDIDICGEEVYSQQATYIREDIVADISEDLDGKLLRKDIAASLANLIGATRLEGVIGKEVHLLAVEDTREHFATEVDSIDTEKSDEYIGVEALDEYSGIPFFLANVVESEEGVRDDIVIGGEHESHGATNELMTREGTFSDVDESSRDPMVLDGVVYESNEGERIIEVFGTINYDTENGDRVGLILPGTVTNTETVIHEQEFTGTPNSTDGVTKSDEFDGIMNTFDGSEIHGSLNAAVIDLDASHDKVSDLIGVPLPTETGTRDVMLFEGTMDEQHTGDRVELIFNADPIESETSDYILHDHTGVLQESASADFVNNTFIGSELDLEAHDGVRDYVVTEVELLGDDGESTFIGTETKSEEFRDGARIGNLVESEIGERLDLHNGHMELSEDVAKIDEFIAHQEDSEQVDRVKLRFEVEPEMIAPAGRVSRSRVDVNEAEQTLRRRPRIETVPEVWQAKLRIVPVQVDLAETTYGKSNRRFEVDVTQPDQGKLDARIAIDITLGDYASRIPGRYYADIEEPNHGSRSSRSEVDVVIPETGKRLIRTAVGILEDIGATRTARYQADILEDETGKRKNRFPANKPEDDIPGGIIDEKKLIWLIMGRPAWWHNWHNKKTR